jgi:hypothetical protein
MPHDPERIDRPIFCPECKAALICPPALEEAVVVGAEGTRFVVSPDGSWAHLGNPDVSRLEFQVTATADPEVASATSEPEPPPKDWSVGIQLGEVGDTANSESAQPTSPAPIAEEKQELLSAFADLEWYETEAKTRAALEAKGYSAGSSQQRANGSRVRFDGSMGGQTVAVTSSFTADDRLELIAVVISVDEPVQRDLYQAMRESLDGKYGTEKVEDHGEAPWSATWLVQSFTESEWSIALAERSEGGQHAVCAYYNSPRAHARAARGAAGGGDL